MRTTTRLTKARRNKLVSILRENGINIDTPIIPTPESDSKIAKLYRKLDK